MATTINGTTGVTFPAGGVGNPASAVVGLTDTQTLTNKTLTSPVTAGTPTGVGVLTSGTAVASTSGTSIDFTSIPSWVKRITVMFQNLSAAGSNSRLLIQIGDSGGIENTGYVSTGAYTNGGAGTSNSETTGYVMDNGGGQPSLFVTGTAVITLLDASTNLWVATHMAELTVAYTMFGGGRKTLSGTLDRVRITSVNGTNTFDSGSINILYE